MIRHAVANDVEAIFRIRSAAIRELAATEYSDEQICAWQGGGSVGAHEAAIATKIVLVEECETGICGFVQFDVETHLVERVYGSPVHARRGSGTRLLRELEAIARERGVTALSLEATLNAVPFYQSAGYVAVEAREDELEAGIVFPYMAMVKALGSESVCLSIDGTMSSRLRLLPADLEHGDS